jgi:NADPH:quinone reductase-like Zn-dependent oxidoreductase
VILAILSNTTTMALPTTQKKWVITGQGRGLDEYNFTDGPVPTVGEHGVLVKLHAASLNYRDHLIPKPKVSLKVD